MFFYLVSTNTKKLLKISEMICHRKRRLFPTLQPPHITEKQKKLQKLYNLY